MKAMNVPVSELVCLSPIFVLGFLALVHNDVAKVFPSNRDLLPELPLLSLLFFPEKFLFISIDSFENHAHMEQIMGKFIKLINYKNSVIKTIGIL